MATTAITAPRARTAPEPILTAPMLSIAGVMLSAMSSFYLLLSAIPAHASAVGGTSGAGAATGALMAATIVGEIAAPQVINRAGRRSALALALGLLGLGCLTAFPASLALLLLNCAVRGLALGVLLVAASGLSAQIAPPSRRAEAMSISGVASAVPAIVAVPLGPWVLTNLGAPGTAVCAATLAFAALAATALLPSERKIETHEAHRLPPLGVAIGPAISLGCGAVLVGATVTFLPLAHPEATSGTIMLGLLLQGLGATVTRWLSARHVDRHGTRLPMLAGLAACVVAAIGLAATGEAEVLCGVLLSGIAFGVLQTATLAELLARAAPSQVDGAGALWNGAYDAGLGIGGIAFGGLATAVGFSTAFVATAGVFTLVALLHLATTKGNHAC
ncbi:MFS transporter [Mesorhizobium sp. WSM4307]|uniref:MFS transporter n=1 Tax=unclassified Mesorhizobium TaxID=325217 RepID=UPI00115EFE21|nr:MULTISPECIES: MFS transporter [unclassified Mesorhizobium]TRC71255.1 MFS transporter [Mesorhizobium sp. WSM4315]TRC86565.1 MFS transporter [Mesorhizobium sp. WSM4307]